MLKEVAREPCSVIAVRKGSRPRDETSLSTSRFVQAPERSCRWINMTLEVEGAADRFACELLSGKYRRVVGKRAAQGKNIKDEWNSGCDRPKLWQVYGKLVSAELNERLMCWATCHV